MQDFDSSHLESNHTSINFTGPAVEIKDYKPRITNMQMKPPKVTVLLNKSVMDTIYGKTATLTPLHKLSLPKITPEGPYPSLLKRIPTRGHSVAFGDFDLEQPLVLPSIFHQH